MATTTQHPEDFFSGTALQIPIFIHATEEYEMLTGTKSYFINSAEMEIIADC